MIVDIPSWSETDERLGQLQRSDRTIARCVLNGIELDPIEAFVHCQEPGGIAQNKEFREKLQAMLDFVAENFNTGQSRINQLERDLTCDRHALGVASSDIQRLEQTNATHKEHIQMVEKHRQEACDKAEQLVDKLNGLIMEVACKCPGESRYETAKRYIHERENRPSIPGQQAQVADSKEG